MSLYRIPGRFSRLLLNKVFASFVISVGILLFVGAASRLAPGINPFYSFFTNADLGVRNILLQRYAETKAHPAITVVTIDDATLSDNGGLGRWQEFKREYYAKVIDQLKKDGALVIGIDVLFSEKASSGDEELRKSVNQAGNVVLGFSAGGKVRGNGGRVEDVAPLFPIPGLSAAAASLGYFNPNVNQDNSVVYSVDPARKIEGKTYESFSLAILRRYLDLVYGKKTSVGPSNLGYEGYYSFHSGDYGFVPYAGGTEGDSLLINYLHESGVSFSEIPFLDVYKGNYDPESVKDHIVLVGSTATALHDEFFTPTAKGGVQPGVYVHANAINTVLNRDYLVNASRGVELAVLALLTFFFSLFLLHVGNRAYQVLVSAVALVLSSAFYVFVFYAFRKQFNYPIELSVIVVMVALASTAYKYMLEEKGKRLLKNALSQYLAEDLVASVLNNYDQMRLGGDRREVTLFFSDIAGFTTLSENMEPEELVNFLSVYLKEVSDIIMNRKGFINKYEGDAVMAIWGAFREQPDQAKLACESALGQQEKITEINREFKTRFGFEIQVRMGINKGPAVVGNIGSEGKKIEFTALGDTVNIASRFEGINKLYGTLVCVGETTMEACKDEFVFRRLDSIMVKGKEKPTSIFELVGRVGEVDNDKRTMISEFEHALALYVSGEAERGRAIFAKLWETYRDAPSEVFMNRCGKLVEEGVPEGWTGIYRATEK